MILAWLCFFDGFVALAVMAAGIVGAHWGLAAPALGFQIFIIGLLNAAFGLLLGLIAVPMAMFSPARRASRAPALIGGILSLVLLGSVTVIVWPRMTKYRPASDLTTDTVHPPQFVRAAQYPANRGRDMSYTAASAQAQQAWPLYASLAPLKLPGTPEDVFKRVAIVAGEVPSWYIMSNDPATRTLEGIAVSKVFHFNDDFIIQVRPADGGGSLVEMRSRSRSAQEPDLGANYERIVSFFHDLQNPPSPAPPGTPQAQP
jgi:uncharacterized protein (DUF1499 family)